MNVAFKVDNVAREPVWFVREQTKIPDLRNIDGLIRIAILAAAYSLTGIVGLSLAIPPGYATAVWPPSGIALAAILLWGPRVWPGVWLGSLLVNIAVALTTAGAEVNLTSLGIAASISVGSTIQALVAAYALRRWVGVDALFESGSATLAFTGITATGCLIAASWGAGTLLFAGVVDTSNVLDSWETWWLGDLIGMLVFAPVFLTWRQSLQVGRRPWRVAEMFLSFALLAAATTIVFTAPTPAQGAASPIAFLPLPILVWIACRFRPSAVALAACLVSLITIAATANGAGPFAGEMTNESMLLLQAFIGLTTFTALMLTATVTGQRQSAQEYQNLSAEMEQLALSDELTGLRNRRGFLVLADQTMRMARRTKAKCALVFIDLDGLKRVNDSRGHAAGDAMITDAAGVLNHVFRESDVVGRVGGDEFAVFALLDEADGESAVRHRLQTAIDQFNAKAVPTMKLSMSVGIEELPCESNIPLSELMSRADRAMYEKKKRQRR